MAQENAQGYKWYKRKAVLIVSILFLFAAELQSKEQNQIVLRGLVFSNQTTPVDFAAVILLEAKAKVYTNEDGAFEISVRPGRHTLLIQSPGYEVYKEEIVLENSQERKFYLKPILVKGGAVLIEEERALQKFSRYTMSREEIKDTPATFGDALGAISSFPGMDRSGGLFGPMMIRGLPMYADRYYIDGIVVRKLQHFLGLHSILHNELIDNVDIFSSAAPVYFGGSVGATLQFNTQSFVDEEELYVETGFLSSNVYYSKPIMRKGGDNQAGFWAVGFRYGYISLILPKILSILDESSYADIGYYDYQMKGNYQLNKNNSLTILLFGGRDRVLYSTKADEQTLEEKIADGADPLGINSTLDYYSGFHSQSLSLATNVGSGITHQLKLYTSLNEVESRENLDDPNAAAAWKDASVVAIPNIFGGRSDLSWNVLTGLTFKSGVDISYYKYRAYGKSLVPGMPESHSPDRADPSAYLENRFDLNLSNKVMGGYLEGSGEAAGWSVAAGLRGEKLFNQNISTLDPAIRAAYASPHGTTLSGGWSVKSAFIQNNFHFLEFAPNALEIENGPMRAVHRVVGIEQRVGAIYAGRAEGYCNHIEGWPEAGELIDGELVMHTGGEMQTCGVELSLEKERTSLHRQFYGRMSASFGESLHRSNLPQRIDSYGERWLPSIVDRPYTVKVVGGYIRGGSSFGARFQLLSSLPETPIVGDDGDPLGITRFAPVYGEPFSLRPEPEYRLDLRYTHEVTRKWGNLRWYVEFINVTNHRPRNNLDWKYNEQYSDANPRLVRSEGFALIPNVGLEMKF